MDAVVVLTLKPVETAVYQLQIRNPSDSLPHLFLEDFHHVFQLASSFRIRQDALIEGPYADSLAILMSGFLYRP